MDNATKPRPFPFFKLPPELRICIYRLFFVTGQSLIIRDMHLDEFEKSQANGTYRSRSTYLAKDHICNGNPFPDCRPCGRGRSCLVQDPKTGPSKLTYTLGSPSSVDATTMTVLSLDKRFREEVASIFYGQNTFHFLTMSSLMPFMKDRTLETRIYIRRLRLTLALDIQTWHPDCRGKSGPATWIKAFSSTLKLPHLNVKELFIQIDDSQDSIEYFNLHSRSMLWLQKLSKFKNLEMLGLRHSVQPWPNYRPEVNIKTEQELWGFLAPKMLKREADDHSPDALLKRRIWDFSRTDEQTSSTP